MTTRTTRSLRWTLATAAAALALAGCGSSGPASTTTSTTTTSMATTTTTEPTQSVAQPITSAVRLSLLSAGAAYHQLTPADYTGLAPNTTYYALDPATHTYYAAAALVPSPSSYRAQVSNQDDGSYLLFTRTSLTAPWKVFNDGLGAVPGTACPVMLPAVVLTAWQWAPHSCYPPS